MRVIVRILILLLGLLTLFNLGLIAYVAWLENYEPIPIYSVIAGLAAVSWYSLRREARRTPSRRFHRPRRSVIRASSRVGSHHTWALTLDCNHLVFLPNLKLQPYPTSVRCHLCYVPRQSLEGSTNDLIGE